MRIMGRGRCGTITLAEAYSVVSSMRIECEALSLETRRIARHLVREGMLTTRDEPKKPFPYQLNGPHDKPRINHVCADCCGVWGENGESNERTGCEA